MTYLYMSLIPTYSYTTVNQREKETNQHKYVKIKLACTTQKILGQFKAMLKITQNLQFAAEVQNTFYTHFFVKN